jgi:hypothetical protein
MYLLLFYLQFLLLIPLPFFLKVKGGNENVIVVDNSFSSLIKSLYILFLSFICFLISKIASLFLVISLLLLFVVA